MATHSDLQTPDGTEAPRDHESVVGERWAAFQAARVKLAAVMTDDELRELGFIVAVLDEEP